MNRQKIAKELLKVAKELVALYSIGEGGLRELKPLNITLEPGAVYALGASGHPDLIVITKVDDDFFSYRAYPYKKDVRIQRVIGEDLIERGTKRWLSTYGQYHPEFAKSMKSGLKGGSVKRYKLKDFQRVTVYAEPVGGDVDDLWRDAEDYGNVGFRSDIGDAGVFEIDTDGFRLRELKKDPNFKVLKVTKKASRNAASRPEITGDRRVDDDIWMEIEDAIFDLMDEAMEGGYGGIDKRGANKAIRDISRQYGADQKTVEHYFWEEYHNTDWPE